MKETRRDFLKKSGGCALGMVSLATQMHHLGTMSALAQSMIDQSASAPDAGYKALVLLFWSGGNDTNNMIIPMHNDSAISNYTAYSNARAANGLALTQAQLQNTQVNVPRLGNLAYAFHPSLGPAATGAINNGIHELYGQGKLAVVANVGTLVRPLTKAQYLSSQFKKPYQLFSHSDQVTQHQTSVSASQAFTGWAGRIADRMTATDNPSGLIPMVTSIAGAQLFSAGQLTLPMAIAQANNTGTPNLTTVLAPVGFTTPSTAAGTARKTAFDALRQQELTSEYVKAASHVTDLAIQANNALQTAQEVTVPFPNTSIGLQLKQVARLIKKRTDLSVSRQIFYVQIGGFDTHTTELTAHTTLFSQFSQAMRAFYDEMVTQGVSNDVTTFTLSDFGRTFQPSGTGALVGTDHGWGNHMFVMGGTVAGGDFYGSKRPDGTGNYYPTLLLGNNPSALDDTDNVPNGRGRWIPTTSVEMYAVRLARWFGLPSADENTVFPNLPAFSTHDQQNSALNFMI